MDRVYTDFKCAYKRLLLRIIKTMSSWGVNPKAVEKREREKDKK
jgi:hypothetical protein